MIFATVVRCKVNMKRRWRHTANSALIALLAIAARADQPVGLVLSAGGSKLLRADAETPLAARAGDLLFSGDGLRTENSSASFLFCPAKAIDTLSASGEVRFDTKAPKVKSGKISEQPARACTLPETLRVAVASQQHYGVTMTRGDTTPEIAPIPRDQLPPDVLAELGTVDMSDPASLVLAGAVF